MTVSNTATRWELISNGSAGPYTYGNKIFAASDLAVYLDGTPTSAFTVTGVGNEAGGTITFTVAPAAGVNIVIERVVPDTQPSDFPPAGPLPALALENALDRRAIVSQQQAEQIARSLRFAKTDPALPSAILPPIATLKNTVLAFDASTGAPYGLSLSSQLVVADWTTPEQFGAVGDGSTDDSAALDLAIATAVGSSQVLRGDPAAVYYVGASLAAFTGTLRIENIHFKAPNGVSLLVGNPSWDAGQSDVTGLSSTVINNSTVTRVTMTSTAWLARDDWVIVASATDVFPGQNAPWAEMAQVVAVAATTVDLHRRLLGEETGLLASDLWIFKVPDYRLEARHLRFEADGDVLATGQSGRQVAIKLRGGIGHLLEDCYALSWWDRFIEVSSAALTRIAGCRWDVLPDIPAANESFGYGVNERSACYGTHVTGLLGGACRHGFTTTTASTGWDSAAPWDIGFPAMATIQDSVVSGAGSAAFDTHAGSYGTTFMGCRAVSRSAQPGGSNARGFQTRGFRTRVLGCTVRGCRLGFSDGAALTDWSTLTPNIVEYDNCRAAEISLDAFLLTGAVGFGDVVVMISGLGMTHVSSGIHLDGAQKFEGRLVIDGLRSHFLADSAVLDDSGEADVQIVDAVLRYTGQTGANVPIRVDTVGAGSWFVDGVTVLKQAASNPNGLIRVDEVSALPVTIGRVTWDLGTTFPMLSSSGDPGASLTISLLRRSDDWLDANGDQLYPIAAPIQTALSSGTSAAITGVRSDAREIDIYLFNLETTGTTDGIELTIEGGGGGNYESHHVLHAATANTPTVGPTDAFVVVPDAPAANDTWFGKIELRLMNPSNDRWHYCASIWEKDGGLQSRAIGTKDLGAALTGFTVRLSGTPTDAFDGSGYIDHVVR